MMTLGELYLHGTGILEDAGIESPSVDAFYLLEHVTGINRTSYLMDKDRTVTDECASAYIDLITRRSEHIPYQYITGEADFLGLKLKVTPDVLIPRLDTEVLYEEAEKLIPQGGRVLDMCTGSGCLAIAVKYFRPDTLVCACDISDAALNIARENAERYCENTNISFIKSDLFSEFGRDDLFDVIISNPPYVTEGEYRDLMPEVREHEPKLALTAGEDGLDVLRRLIPDAAGHLQPGGWLIMEIGYQQAGSVFNLMENSGYIDIRVTKDLAGLDRVIQGRLGGLIE